MYGQINRIHFVGIGGSGMNGIAEVLCNLGYDISGSDIKETEITRRLAKMGCRIYKGHGAENVEGADVLVVSSAIGEENIEVKTARKRNIPVIPRAEMLAELMRMKYGILIAGSHGKTSTTSMIASILNQGGTDPTVVIGGRLNTLDSNARMGKGDFMVAEADESDGSFLQLSPAIAVLTNIDYEHMNYYQDFDALKEAFLEFVNQVPFYGACVLCMNDSAVQDILPRVERRLITYGTVKHSDYVASSIEYEGFSTGYTLSYQGNELGRIELNVPGEYNVLNSMAAVAVARDLDISFDTIKETLKNFKGADRRFHLKGEAGGIMVIDDYGHHPTEIQATLEALKKGWEDRRIIAVFQPHRYSRVKNLHRDFCKAFYLADAVIMTDIYPAGEDPIEGVNVEKLYRGFKDHGYKNITLRKDMLSVPEYLEENLRAGDILITLGAGDVYKVGERFLKRMKNNED